MADQLQCQHCKWSVTDRGRFGIFSCWSGNIFTLAAREPCASCIGENSEPGRACDYMGLITKGKKMYRKAYRMIGYALCVSLFFSRPASATQPTVVIAKVLSAKFTVTGSEGMPGRTVAASYKAIIMFSENRMLHRGERIALSGKPIQFFPMGGLPAMPTSALW